ncbi:hypothetical protein [Salinispira pacifica]
MVRVCRGTLILTLLSLLPVRAVAVDLACAGLRLRTADPGITLSAEEISFGSALLSRVRERDADGIFALHEVPDREVPEGVCSALDARRLASLFGYELVLYGSVEVGTDFVEADLSLYERETDRVRKRLFSKVARGEITDAQEDLARRLIEYASRTFGRDPRTRVVAEDFGGILTVAGLGTWIALGEWKDTVSGVVEGFTGLRVVPVKPLRRGADWLSYLRFGCDIRYRFGTDAPAVVPARIHGFALVLPAELCLEPDRHSVICFGLGPELLLLYAFQQPPYAEASSGVAGALGFSGYVGYEYRLGGNRRFSVGTRATFGGDLFEPLLLQTSLDIYASIRFSTGRGTTPGTSPEGGNR